MFEQLVESTARRKKDGRWRYFGVTAIVWTLALSGIVMGGVFAYDARLDGQLDLLAKLVAPAPPVRLGSEAPRPQPRGPISPVTSPWTNPPKTPPKTIPDPPPISQTNFDLSSTGDSRGHGDPGSSIIGDPYGVKDGIAPPANVDPAPPPRPASKPKSEELVTPNRPLRVSTGPLQGQAVRKIEPAYPTLAKQAHVEGVVSVEVLIDEHGNVVSARALSGHLLLRDAAVSAARSWKWNPTMLNGAPVQVVGSITFNFALR